MKLIDDFNIYLKGKAVEELEKATNVTVLGDSGGYRSVRRSTDSAVPVFFGG